MRGNLYNLAILVFFTTMEDHETLQAFSDHLVDFLA